MVQNVIERVHWHVIAYASYDMHLTLRWLKIRIIEFSFIFSYIDVGDGCWGRNVMVTTRRCWWQFWPFWSPTSNMFLHERRAPTSQRCHQHRNFVTNIPRSSPTLGHQHHDFITITVMTYHMQSRVSERFRWPFEPSQGPSAIKPNIRRWVTYL